MTASPVFGFDLNENEVLDADEVFERPIVIRGDLADLAPIETDNDDDIALEDLRDVPHAVVVHASTVTDQTYLSCGEIEEFRSPTRSSSRCCPSPSMGSPAWPSPKPRRTTSSALG